VVRGDHLDVVRGDHLDVVRGDHLDVVRGDHLDVLHDGHLDVARDGHPDVVRGDHPNVVRGDHPNEVRGDHLDVVRGDHLDVHHDAHQVGSLFYRVPDADPWYTDFRSSVAGARHQTDADAVVRDHPHHVVAGSTVGAVRWQTHLKVADVQGLARLDVGRDYVYDYDRTSICSSI
jgi:hypothetical protein